MLRFINNSRSRNKVEGTPKLKEINQAVIHICKIVQHSHFSEDLERLKSNKPCTSRISSLPPFLDDAGLVRVGGRIKNFHLPSAAKHPIILPKVYQTNLIIDFYHIKHLHSGPNFLQATILQKFWILSARSDVRHRIFKCIRYFKCKPTLCTQKVGNLPSPKVIPGRVFNNYCSTDF